MASGNYEHLSIEKKWQDHWVKQKTFRTTEDPGKKKYYVLDFFPYPSGAGLHVGHPLGYFATDIVARYKRMRGYNVLHPMGWDAFGLPAEQYAMKTGVHPRKTTDANIATFRRQLQALGLSYDWDREVDTTDKKYYRWTQWIFLKLFERGLAYESFAPVNWCPALGTVLANEEVIDGKSEIGSHPVIKKPMRQWVLKITAYAERLINDLDDLDWPEAIKQQQRNWIGRSEGALIRFAIKDFPNESLQVFTTRPDTIFGVTYMVLAPELDIVKKITTSEQRSKVDAYIESTLSRSERDRQADKVKTGEFTGAYALHPITQKPVPIYIADYVLSAYGTGAIMAVPAHDERDHEFARLFHLPIIQVLDGAVKPVDEVAHVGDGKLIDSQFLNGLSKDAAIQKAITWFEEHKCGERQVNYKLRDWLFSRQRYWGEPIPIVHNHKGEPCPLLEKDLPLVLPELEDFQPTGSGESPLARAEEWIQTKIDGQPGKRETNTMPQWAGSCWYYLRFIDPKNDSAAWDSKKEQFWMPVDLYMGGAEHAVLHLLYARFWHKVLYDAGLVSTKEPFQRLVNQGMILGENNEKMSKSRGNVINPDDVIQEWGADTLRLYEMFLGPLTATKPWQTQGIAGVARFLRRVWRLIVQEESGALSSVLADKENSEEFKRLWHRTLKKVTEDTEGLQFNTAIAAMMEFTNAAYKQDSIDKKIIIDFVKILSPYAPHAAEELYERLGGSGGLAYVPWPQYDADLAREDDVTISVQVNGKMRATIIVARGTPQATLRELALAEDGVKRHLQDKQIVKEIFVADKIMNFVVR